MIRICIFLTISPTILALQNDTYITLPEGNIFNDNEFVHLSKCIVQAAKNDLFYKSTILINRRNKSKVTNQERNLLNIMVQEMNFETIPLVIIDDSYKIIDGDKYDGNLLYIIIREECKDLENVSFTDVQAKYLFILTGDVSNCNNVFDNIGQTLSENEITIAYKDENNIFDFIYASIGMDQSTCKLSEHLDFNKISMNCNAKKSRMVGSILQPKYLRDFRQCPFNFGLATLHPYMTMKNKENYKNLDPIVESDISGSDVELLKIIAKYFNATLNFYFIYRQEENPFADKEFISLVQNGSLDVCAGGLYRVYGDTVAYSGIYTRQAVIWVYSVAREIRSWQSFVIKVNGLYMFLIFYAVYSVFWKIMAKLEGQSVSLADTLLYGWGALLGTTSLQDARNLKQKFANAMYLIMSVHLSAYLGVQLYSYLTVQGPPHIYKTIDELISSGIKPYLRYQSKYFIEDKKYEAFANTSGSCDNFIHCSEVILDKKGTTVLIDGFLPPYQAGTAIHDEARVVQVSEVILFVYHEMIMRKNSFFSEPFRKTLLHLFEAGICQKLYNDAVGIMYVDKARIANKNIMSNSYSCQAGCKITLTQSAGAFYIWILGCLLSSITFLFEVFLLKERKRT